ncbi:hypothetical protein [Nocardiopsis sp. JB363]|uniref:hypothetical protein n=1 Tax=Nocardiopsis sp. JB363 TaxID=1434837 RepID=UPI00097AF5BB|nr:hypothetical protein [Nocardiopsis sp. JB363]SIO86161.1 hypothetical protein BQ8420_10600 [Nocardiopsis sp. JB363]
MAFFEWLQSRLHAECDTVIAFYDRDRRSIAQAQVASAAAHHDAEVELAEAREAIARLEAELVAERDRTDQARAALALGGPLTVEEALSGADVSEVLEAAWRHVYAVRLSLLAEADRQRKAEGGADYVRHLERMVEIYRQRILRASELMGGLTPYQERLEELLALAPAPVPPEQVST